MRPDSGVVIETTDAIRHEVVIPAKAGIHFDFSAGGAATVLLSRGVRMRNPEDSPLVFVFDSVPRYPRIKPSEGGGEKAKAKMDSVEPSRIGRLRHRNDGQNPKSGGGAGGHFLLDRVFQHPLDRGV